MTKTVHDVLADIQAKVAVPKGHNNDFGGYKYRKAEDILTAARDVAPAGTVILLSDRIAEVCGQIFVIATASIAFGGQSVSAEAGAMHPLQKKGMDASQITGTASSYARKYAMQGLFALDDGRNDPDSRDNREENGITAPPFDPRAAADRIIGRIQKAADFGQLRAIWAEEKDAIAEIKAARPAMALEIEAAKDKRKAAVDPALQGPAMEGEAA